MTRAHSSPHLGDLRLWAKERSQDLCTITSLGCAKQLYIYPEPYTVTSSGTRSQIQLGNLG